MPPAAPVHSRVAGGVWAFAALIIANVALAFGPWFVRLADTGPVAAAFWRVSLAAPILFALAMAGGWRATTKGSLPDRAIAIAILVAGVSFAADLASWHVGIGLTTLANATLFGNTATLIFPIYGFIIARAWPGRDQLFALALAATGGALLMGASYSLNPQNLLGDLLSLAAGILYTVYFIGMARARAVMPPLVVLGFSSLASAVPLLVLALVLGEPVWPGDWRPVIGLMIASQLIGQGLMIYALGHLSPLVIGLGLLVQPVVAAAIGWLAYGERLGPADAIGAVLVAVALVLARRAPPPEPLESTPPSADMGSDAFPLQRPEA